MYKLSMMELSETVLVIFYNSSMVKMEWQQKSLKVKNLDLYNLMTRNSSMNVALKRMLLTREYLWTQWKDRLPLTTFKMSNSGVLWNENSRLLKVREIWLETKCLKLRKISLSTYLSTYLDWLFRQNRDSIFDLITYQISNPSKLFMILRNWFKVFVF